MLNGWDNPCTNIMAGNVCRIEKDYISNILGLQLMYQLMPTSTLWFCFMPSMNGDYKILDSQGLQEKEQAKNLFVFESTLFFLCGWNGVV